MIYITKLQWSDVSMSHYMYAKFSSQQLELATFLRNVTAINRPEKMDQESTNIDLSDAISTLFSNSCYVSQLTLSKK